VNAVRGIVSPSEHTKLFSQRPAPGARPETQRSAMCRGTTMSARSSWLPGAVRRRRSDTPMENGGFDTTRNGRRGNRMSLPSAWTTTTLLLTNFWRSSRARAGCNSNAMTRAPLRSSGSVKAPEPAPISSTRSPVRIAALSTSRSAHGLSRRCHPHRVRCPDTADHREHCHAKKLFASVVDVNNTECLSKVPALPWRSEPERRRS
jgi:hypothetical protein